MSEPSQDLQSLKTVQRVLPFFIIFVGSALVIVNVMAGFQQWHFLLTLLLGALLHTLFRVTKRMFKRTLEAMVAQTEHDAAGVSVEQAETFDRKASEEGADDVSPTKAAMGKTNAFGLIYFIMLFVTAFWYGIGALLGWLFGG